MKRKTLFFDGTKSINAWDLDSNVGWAMLSGGEGGQTEDQFFRSVPWLYRGVLDRANNVAAMPFALMRGESEVDNSQSYNDWLGFLPSPVTLFQLLEMSLCMSSRAYAKLEVNKSGYVKAMRYLAPSTMTEKYNRDTGALECYERRVNGKMVTLLPIEVIAIYLPDYTVEIGAGKASPATAALVSSGVLYNSDKFVSSFFERGAIKATILTTTGTDKAEADRLQRWWDKVMTGIKNAWTSFVLRGEAVKPTVIGEGLESLTNESLTKERRQNIATALGVPESRMWSAAANYATRLQDDKSYWEGTIIPECTLIAEAFNRQLFTQEHHLDGVKIRFQKENLQLFQSDAREQAGALSQLTGSGVPLLIAMDLLGFDLTDEQRAEMEPKPEPEPTPVVVEPVQETVPVEETPEYANAKTLWQRKAIKRLKETGSAACDFTGSVIPDLEKSEIASRLSGCKSADEVRALFGAKPVTLPDEPEESGLLAELKRANDLLEKAQTVKAEPQAEAEPMPNYKMSIPAITLNVTPPEMTKLDELAETIGRAVTMIVEAQSVKPEPAQIIVNVPEQTPPVVNVAPAQVNVNVPKADPVNVTVNVPEPKPKTLTVTRDRNGNLSGITEKQNG